MTIMTSGRAIAAAALLATATAAPADILPGVAGAASPSGLAPAALQVGQLDRAQGLRHDLRHGVQRERGKSAAEAAREARRQHGGKVLSVTREGEGQRAYYRVKLIEEGNVRVVRIPAN